MDDIISLILNGCKLASELEANLPNITNRPDMVSRSCDEIIKRFLAARERLNVHHQADPATNLFNYPGDRGFHEQQVHAQKQQQIDANFQEWLKSSVTQAMDIIQTQLLGADQRNPFDHISEREMEGTSTTRLRSMGGDHQHHHRHHHVQPMDVSDSSRGSSSSQPRHRRSENARIVTVPAPQIGNTEVPPEDGYTWRKYGQKEILNSKFPRSYYRCTHQRLYQCPAKKQVQRLDDDPFTFEIVYQGDHTCHMSLTAPSSAPPTSAEIIISQEMMTQSVAMQQPSSSTSNLGRWLTMNVGAASGGGGGGAGPSTVRYEREAAGAGDQYFVANMADAMFNSGSSSSNSMEFLFPLTNMEDQWNQEDKKDNEP